MEIDKCCGHHKNAYGHVQVVRIAGDCCRVDLGQEPYDQSKHHDNVAMIARLDDSLGPLESQGGASEATVGAQDWDRQALSKGPLHHTVKMLRVVHVNLQIQTTG